MALGAFSFASSAYIQLCIALGFDPQPCVNRRVTILFIISAIGGNLVSGAFEVVLAILCFVNEVPEIAQRQLFCAQNACLVFVGASGGVFGIFGLYVADLVVNFDTIKQPVLRTAAVLLFLGLFIYTVATEVRLSLCVLPYPSVLDFTASGLPCYGPLQGILLLCFADGGCLSPITRRWARLRTIPCTSLPPKVWEKKLPSSAAIGRLSRYSRRLCRVSCVVVCLSVETSALQPCNVIALQKVTASISKRTGTLTQLYLTHALIAYMATRQALSFPQNVNSFITVQAHPGLLSGLKRA